MRGWIGANSGGNVTVGLSRSIQPGGCFNCLAGILGLVALGLVLLYAFTS